MDTTTEHSEVHGNRLSSAPCRKRRGSGYGVEYGQGKSGYPKGSPLAVHLCPSVVRNLPYSRKFAPLRGSFQTVNTIHPEGMTENSQGLKRAHARNPPGNKDHPTRPRQGPRGFGFWDPDRGPSFGGLGSRGVALLAYTRGLNPWLPSVTPTGSILEPNPSRRDDRA